MTSRLLSSESYNLWHLQGYVLQMIYILAPTIYCGHTFPVLQHNLWVESACASQHTCKAHSTCYICTACSFGYMHSMLQIALMHIQHSISHWNIFVLSGNEQTRIWSPRSRWVFIAVHATAEIRCSKVQREPQATNTRVKKWAISKKEAERNRSLPNIVWQCHRAELPKNVHSYRSSSLKLSPSKKWEMFWCDRLLITIEQQHFNSGETLISLWFWSVMSAGTQSLTN